MLQLTVNNACRVAGTSIETNGLTVIKKNVPARGIVSSNPLRMELLMQKCTETNLLQNKCPAAYSQSVGVGHQDLDLQLSGMRRVYRRHPHGQHGRWHVFLGAVCGSSAGDFETRCQ